MERSGCRPATSEVYLRSLALGGQHPAVSRSLHNLAEIYRKESRYLEAEPLYVRSLMITGESLGPTHPDTAVILSHYALLMRKLHRNKEARKLEAQVRRSQSKSDAYDLAKFEVDWRDLRRREK